MRPSEVELTPLPLEPWQGLLGSERWQHLADTVQRGHKLLDSRGVWCVNSTATGGGVAEMLRTLLAYVRGTGIDARWAVIEGEPNFFRVTKRIHNMVHGSAGDGGRLGDAEREVYDAVTEANLPGILELIDPGEPVILHDPQTAGLVKPLQEHGCPVVWRSHIGAEKPNEHVEEAWEFIAPYVESADALVFSRFAYIPPALADGPDFVIPPSIDPFAPKNEDHDPDTARAIVIAAGLVQGSLNGASPAYHRLGGKEDEVRSRAMLLDGCPAPPADAPLVLQVSRWDRLKDHVGVMKGFASALDEVDAHLILAGPDARSVADDPEGLEALAEIQHSWHYLPKEKRQRVHIASLPMDDTEENAAIVNALQRHATIVVQKSLEEGFGLTVTEAMWKARPMIASAVGGIREQVEDGRTGVLLDDPYDLDTFGAKLAELLKDSERATRLGDAGRQNVCDHFLHDRHFRQYVELLEKLDAQQ